ncbi:MAG: CapA family protein [Acidobacteriota bacterium]
MFLAKRVVLCAILGTVACSRPERAAPVSPGQPSTKDEPALTILAVGDINLGRQCGQSLLTEGTHYPFGHLRSWIESFDLAFCNLESNISEQGGETVKPDNRLIFTAPPVAALALRRSGWDLVSTANNHSSDYGLKALRETVMRLEAAGVPFNGTARFASDLYQPTYLRVKGRTVAFLAVTDVSNAPIAGTALERHLNVANRECLLPALQAAEQLADLTILSYHGGDEYSDSPTGGTRAFLHWAVDQGADLILGHHPHVIQGVETYRGALIIYSLGNFTFYQGSTPYWTDYGMAASISIGRKGVLSAEFVPIRAHFQPRVIKEKLLRRKVLARLARLSNALAEPGTTAAPGIINGEGKLDNGDD